MNLIEAIKENNQTEFFRLLNLKVDLFGKKVIDEVDTERNGSPLHWAAVYGYVHFITPLVKAGAAVNKPSKGGATPVYISAQNGHAAAIAALHAAGANVNTPNANGATPVYIAALKGHAEAICALHAAGANVNTPKPDGTTPVSIAAQNGHAAAITALKAAGANVNTPDNDGITPVFVAAQNGHAEAITVLKAAGANVNTPKPDGTTPVSIAAQNGHAEAIRALHAAGANVNTPYRDGRTPVSIAAQQGHAEAIRALHAAGANVNTPDKDGITPVFVAAQNGHADAITVLKAAGANVNTSDNDGWTPICIAAQKNHAVVIAALHAAGANVNTPYKGGATPVFVAAVMDNALAIAALHAAGANVNTPIPDGTTPVFISAQQGHAEAITALLEAGVDAGVETPFGTALEEAEKGKEPEHKKVVKLLEGHLQQYPSGIKPVKAIATNKEATQALMSKSLSSSHKEVKTIYDSPTEPKKPVPRLPITSKEASNPIPSVNPLLQNLQMQLMQGEKKTAAPNSSRTQTGIKASLGTLTHDLEENQKEKQSLGQTSQELKTQSKRLQETLQKEITTQESERAHLEQQQETFKKQIADLEKSLAQKSAIEQRAIQTHLEALEEQSLVVQTKLEVLWNEHEIKAQKREALKRFQSHPNLLLFYRTVHIKLEEIFISFKAVAGGFVKVESGNVAIAKSIFDVIGDVASIAPIVGTAVDKVLKWTVSKGLKKLDHTRQKNTAINASGLVTLSEVKKYAESIARQLTERYADQLERLMTPEEEQAAASKFKQGLAKMKEITLKDASVPSAKKLAVFGVLWIIDQLYDSETLDESKELDEALLSVISQKPLPNKLKEFWQEITTTLGLEGVRSKSGETWHPASVYTLPGLRVDDKYYSTVKLQPNRYGWRVGTAQEVQALGLSQVPAPTTQAFALETQKVVRSISAVNNTVKKVEQKTDEHGERLEKIEKTGDIAGGARLKALQEKQETDGKTIEEMRLQIAQLKSTQDARTVSPSPKRRPSGIKDFTKQSEQENMLDALKELRKFFLGQRDKGEESTNIETYEKYLKMANKDAELIYQQEDRVHVLCIDGNVLDRTAAAQAIGNMIKTLELQTQSTVPAAHQPMRSVSPAPVNSLRVIPTVVPPSSPTQPRMLAQFNQPTPPARRVPTRQLSQGFRNGLTREG